MKKPIFVIMWISMLLIGTHVKAQYTLMPITPPPSFSFNDLWHFTVVRPVVDNNTQFYVSLRVFDGVNQLKVKSNTATVSLPTGSHYYNLSNISLLQPFSTSYYDAGILQQAIHSGGNFPPGTYRLVYTLYGKSADGEFIPLSEDVSEAVVETLWPPTLLSPADEEIIDTQYPILTWTPAFSSSYLGQITYTLNLVELYPGQNTYQAIAANPLYFTQNNIPVTMLPYPPSAQLLDTAKTYVWQVHADAQGVSLGSSEIWSFSFATPEQDIEIPDSVQTLYYNVEYEYPSTFVITSEKKIRFKFEDGYHQDSDNLLSFSLYREGAENPILTTATCNTCMVVSQNIYHSIGLEDNNDFVSGFYLLKIYDTKKRIKYLRILYKDEN